MITSINLLFDPKVDEREVQIISKAIEEIYKIEVTSRSVLKIKKAAYNRKRKQYNGQKLLNELIDEENREFFFWIVEDDLYVPVMNFVFGLATQFCGAIVSFNRLESLEMKIKESVHECGHILGLGHCSNFCVMQYSSNLQEAIEKPSSLCSTCENKIKENKRNFEPNKD
ncbi:MAG: peptidase [Candidatus Heimdallarchaeota archaeon]|nr:peptidase [Candidatus Heimdallarchaeota archaeon]MCK4878481.1 peptidase [Candidatus Heimdallarchaeota archaeon]